MERVHNIYNQRHINASEQHVNDAYQSVRRRAQHFCFDAR